MNTVKCPNCGLVDIIHESACRRCGTLLYRGERSIEKGPREKKGLSVPLWPAAATAVVAFVAYTYMGDQPANTANSNARNHQASQPQPKPTLSLRAEHEQRQTGAYKNAIQSSSGLAESQKHVEETQKLMQSEPPKPKR